MIRESDLCIALEEVGIGRGSHVLVHSSYKAFGGVVGGPAAVVRALVWAAATVMTPATTWDRNPSPYIWDAAGDLPGNAYPRPDPVHVSVPFSPELPIDREIGIIPETLRTVLPVKRSGHPLQSFVAHGERAVWLTSGDPFDVDAPIRRLMDVGGDLLLIGVGHTRSTAVHVAEHLEGRRPFIRHALTETGVVAAPTNGCSRAFDQLAPHVLPFERRTMCGDATLRAYDLQQYIAAARALLSADRAALLCGCNRCWALQEYAA